MLAKSFPDELRRHKREERLFMIDGMLKSHNIDDTLKKVLPCGIAYHHSGGSISNNSKFPF